MEVITSEDSHITIFNVLSNGQKQLCWWCCSN